MQLAGENKNLIQEKTSLQTRVAPLEELEAKIIDLEKREKLATTLENGVHPWSSHFRMIYQVAQKNGLRVSSLSTATEKKMCIRDSSCNVVAQGISAATFSCDTSSNVHITITCGGGDDAVTLQSSVRPRNLPDSEPEGG